MKNEEVSRYMKQMLLDDIGLAGQKKLKSAKVLVIGAGGLGCPVLLYLTSAGIGTIGIVDYDRVEVSNLHRQVLYGENDLGIPKVEAAITKLTALNKHTQIIAHNVKINETNAAQIINDYDLVIDGCDNFTTRYIVNDNCVALQKPLVYGSILGYQGQIAVFNHNSKNLRDIFPEPPNPEDVPSCDENGVLATVPGIVGIVMAQTALSLILGKNTFENKFIIIDTLTMDKTELSY